MSGPVAADRCDLLCLDLPRAEALRRASRDPEQVAQAAREAKALSDPTRLALAAVLLDGEELCVCDLSWVLERAENLVSHHLRHLRSEGLVASRRDGKMVMYSVTDRGRELLGATLRESVPA
jgi:ArsR family transcriptional regulator, lead/cadmium/zinc/bismuth-responsive transcriptional repressor